MTEAVPVPAFIYARQSRTRDGSESLDIQVDECKRAAERLGLEIVGQYVEPPSTSGYKNRGRSRGKFAEMLEAIKRGEARAILVYKSERLSRGGGPGWAPVFEAIESAGLNVDRAVATPNGWMSEFEIGIRATMDREESKKLSDRIKDVRARQAKEGRFGGGGLRPFGFEEDRKTHRPSEAALIREAADRVLAGESLYAIVLDWQRREIESPGGAGWRTISITRVLRSARIAGLREHNGETLGEASWDAIIDRPTWELLQAAMTQRRTGRKVTSRPRTFPLTGLLVCGVCGQPLRGSSRGGNIRQYRCSRPTETGGQSCGGLAISANTVEADVFDVIADTVLDPETLQRLATAAGTEVEVENFDAEIADLDARRARLVDIFESGDIEGADYRERVARITGRLDQIRADLAVRAGGPTLSDLPGTEDELKAAWTERGIEWQRTLIDALVERIEVKKGQRGVGRPQDRLVYTLR